MRVVFAGSPAIAVPSLEALAAEEFAGRDIELVAVLTNPDSRKGRKGSLEPTEVGARAAQLQDTLREKGHKPFLIVKPEKLDASRLASFYASMGLIVHYPNTISENHSDC